MNRGGVYSKRIVARRREMSESIIGRWVFQSMRSFSRGTKLKKSVELSIFNDANSRGLGAL